MARLGYKFSNLCGTVYKGGNLVFTPDGNTLLSPVGNRITAFELVSCVHDGCGTTCSLVIGLSVRGKQRTCRLTAAAALPRRHSSTTLDFEARSDIDRVAIAPDGRLLLVIDVGA